MTSAVSAVTSSGARIPTGFSPMGDIRPRTRLVAVSFGETSSGKTHWSICTAPEPVFHLILDRNADEIRKKITRLNGREIYPSLVAYTPNLGEAEAKKAWKTLTDSIDAVLAVNQGTLVIDTASEVDSLLRLATYGRLEKVMPFAYSDRNKMWKALFSQFYDSSMSVILIHKMKPKWINNQKTAEYEIAGWADVSDGGVEFEAQMVTQHRWDSRTRQFMVRVLKQNMFPDLMGEESDADTLSLGNILDLTFGDE